MPKNQRMNLPAWEWLALIGVILGSVVSVTGFAMTHFETATAAEVREAFKLLIRKQGG